MANDGVGTGPKIIGVTRTVLDELNTFRVDFDEPVDPVSFPASLITLTTPGGTAIDPGDLLLTPSAGSDSFDVTLPAQTAIGDYALTIDPALTDFDGNALDQDGDGNGGETGDDTFSTTIDLRPLTVFSGSISTETTWTGTVHLTGNTSIVTGITLHIDPGTVIKLNRGAWFEADGILDAQGTADDPITFTTVLDDDIGGDLSGPGIATPLRGEWEAIYLDSLTAGSTLTYVNVLYAGNRSAPGNGFNFVPAVQIRGKDGVVMSNVQVLESDSTAVSITSASPQLTSVHVDGAAGDAFFADIASAPTLSDLTVGNVSGVDYALGSGDITADRNWNFGGLAATTIGSITVNTDVTLDIDPGQVIKFATGAFFEIDGILVAVGTEGAPIVLTSGQDDSAGGDSNHDGTASTPRRGDWEAVYLDSLTVGSTLTHVEVRYAGNRSSPGNTFNFTPAIQIREKQGVVMTDVRVYEADEVGISITGAAPQLTRVHVDRVSGDAFTADIASTPTLMDLSVGAAGRYDYALGGGSISDIRTWNFGGLAATSLGNISVEQGATLGIDPGEVIKFRSGDFLEIDGTLNAIGTPADPIVLTSEHDDEAGGDSNHNGDATVPLRGHWEALYLDSLSAGSTLRFVEVRFAGNAASPGNTFNFTPAVQIREKQDVVLENVIVRDVDQIGVDITGAVSPVLTDVSVFRANSVPFRLAIASTPTLTRLTAADTAGDHVQLVAGTITTGRTWDFGGLPAHTTGNITVGAGTTLTIAPDTVVKFAVGARFRVDGTVTAVGTDAQRIIFTAISDDTAGGDSNADGTTTAGVAGSWEHLELNADSDLSRLEYVEIRFAGNAASPGNTFNFTESVDLNETDATFRNVLVADGELTGFRIDGGAPTLVDVHVTRVNDVPYSLDMTADPVLDGITASDSAVQAVRLDGGTLDADRTWDVTILPYIFGSTNLTVAAGVTLALGPGTVLKFFDGQLFNVAGTLDAVGTLTDPIVLTAAEDDTAGGDLLRDGDATVPITGSWEALRFSDTSVDSVLEHVDVRWAGNR
ncbi:MAG: hypothetical protein CMJ18_23000, partial [Phycisphaeraceae bacterium]|nr:hypothetical protein [Phycisphaeraceae bacterium]